MLQCHVSMEEEPEIPRWCARMPGDPEIDRDVKSGEEKLWEAVYDNKTEKMELLFKMLDECVVPPRARVCVRVRIVACQLRRNR